MLRTYRRRRRKPRILPIVAAAIVILALITCFWRGAIPFSGQSFQKRLPDIEVSVSSQALSLSSYKWNYLSSGNWKTAEKSELSKPKSFFVEENILKLDVSSEDYDFVKIYATMDGFAPYELTSKGEGVYSLPPCDGIYSCSVVLGFDASQDEPYGELHYDFTIDVDRPLKVSLSSETVDPGETFWVIAEYANPGDQLTVKGGVAGSGINLARWNTNDPSGRSGTGEPPLPDTPHAALLAHPSSATPGDYSITVTVTDVNGQSSDIDLNYTINEKNFPKQELSVSQSLASLRSDANEKIDNQSIEKAISSGEPFPLWSSVKKPLDGQITTQYGENRYVNGTLDYSHSGIDIAEPKGTPVPSAADGKVVFSGSLIVSGNTVIIDHGLNLFSMYCHLDSTAVSVGDAVKQGDIVGELGNTGFSTGPHLHWQVKLGTVDIDPLMLVDSNPLEYIKSYYGK